MINLDQYLSAEAVLSVGSLQCGDDFKLSHLWGLMDQAQVRHACNNHSLNSERS